MNIYIIVVINALLNNLYGRFHFMKNLRSNVNWYFTTFARYLLYKSIKSNIIDQSNRKIINNLEALHIEIDN